MAKLGKKRGMRHEDWVAVQLERRVRASKNRNPEAASLRGFKHQVVESEPRKLEQNRARAKQAWQKDAIGA